VTAVHRLSSLDDEPEVGPLWLPPAYFLAAILWLGVAAAVLPVVAPDLARGLVYQPRVFAVTHALTLGVITGAIFGALHQFIPAVLGVAPRSPRAATLGFWCFQAGVAVVSAAFWRWSPLGQAVGWVLIFVGVGGASWNTLPARRRATRNQYVGVYVSLGHSALGLAMLLAAVRIGDGLGWWHTGREGLLAAHFHLGALGLGSLTAVGFGSKMLPAFLGTRDPPTGPLGWIGWLASTGLLLFTTGAVAQVAPLIAAGGAVLAVSAGAHLGLIGRYFVARTRPLDPGLTFVLVAATCYAAALAMGVTLLVTRPRPGAAWAAYAILALPGWLGLLILGVMHRVVPRILTLIRVRRGGPLTPVHRRVELVSLPLAWASVGLLGLGVPGLALTVLLGWTTGATASGLTIAAGVACVAAQGAHVARRAC
jgi:hypothetical protein